MHVCSSQQCHQAVTFGYRPTVKILRNIQTAIILTQNAAGKVPQDLIAGGIRLDKP